MKKITLIGLFADRNLGDPIIGCTTEYLIKEMLHPSNIVFERINLAYTDTNKSLMNRIWEKVLIKLFGIHDDSFLLTNSIRNKEYFDKVLVDTDCIVIVGGGLIKFSTQYFGEAIKAICNRACQLHIPVILNSIGIEGYDETNTRCLTLKKILKSPSIISISTRDDIETLKLKYLDDKPKHILIEKVADPAVWAADAYNITPTQASNVIGVNIGRANLFKDYGRGITKTHLLQVYSDSVKRIMQFGFEVELFTNGLDSDTRFARELEVFLNKQKCFPLIKIPNSAQDLIRIISRYKGIVATRLHASIIAYSMNIPAISLMWNEKIKFFYNNIGNPEYCLEDKLITPDIIIETLNIAIKKGYNQNVRNEYRLSIKENLSKIFKTLKNY